MEENVSLMRWDDISNRKHLRPKIIEETIEKIKMIRKYLLAVQSRADKRVILIIEYVI